jgi:hypothetical protein
VFPFIASTDCGLMQRRIAVPAEGIARHVTVHLPAAIVVTKPGSTAQRL